MGLDFRDQEMVLKMSVLLNKRVPFQPAQSYPGFAQERSRAHGAECRIVTSVLQKCLLCSLRALAAPFLPLQEGPRSPPASGYAI